MGYALVVFAALAVLCGPAQCAEKVQLGFYSESLCPDCLDYSNGPLEKAINEARDVPAVFCRSGINYCYVYSLNSTSVLDIALVGLL